MYIEKGTRNDMKTQLRAATAGKSLKVCLEEKGPDITVTGMWVLLPSKDEEEKERSRVVIEVDGTDMYFGVADSVLRTVTAAIDFVMSTEEDILPLECHLEKAPGRYGKFMLTVV